LRLEQQQPHTAQKQFNGNMPRPAIIHFIHYRPYLTSGDGHMLPGYCHTFNIFLRMLMAKMDDPMTIVVESACGRTIVAASSRRVELPGASGFGGSQAWTVCFPERKAQ
jgi:hypothetical protein